jgi:hypothetical protein
MKTRLGIVSTILAIAIGCSGSENTSPSVPPEAGTPADASDGAADASDGAKDASVESSAPESGASDSSRSDGFIDIFDAFSVPDGPLGGCVTCIRDRCGDQVNQCVNDSVCRAGLQCTLATCLGTGMPDVTCVLACFMGDTVATLTAVGALTCINMSCGATCMAGLDGGAPGDAGTAVDGSPPDSPTPPDANATDASSTEASAIDSSSAGGDGSGD